MEEGYMNPFVEMGASLAELVIKGTASAVNKKIRAAKEIKDSEKLRIMYDELINEVLQEREEDIGGEPHQTGLLMLLKGHS